MDGENPNPETRPGQKASFRSFLEHCLRMPKWHKTFLTLAVMMLGVGGAGQLATAVSASPGSGATAPALVVDQPAWQRHAPAITKSGFSFIAAFVIGWLSRIFLKTVAMVASLGVALFAGLSYLNVFNIDLTKAEKKYDSGVAWVKDQGERGFKAVSNHIPGSASGALGMFVGFKRKK